MKKSIQKLIPLAFLMLFSTATASACSPSAGATGPAGPAGVDGKSAYEIAVEQGFEGTVDEWLASLIGKGEDGVGIDDITIDYRGIVVITLTNGEKYETTIDKTCPHTNMESIVTYPTCAATGYTSYSCPDCGLSYKNDYTESVGHHLYNGKCLTCNYEVPYGEIEPDTSWYNTYNTSYSLTTREELAGLAYLVNNGTTLSGTTITLANHIDLGNAEWIPIGTSSNPFAGTFDGQNYDINNLKITAPTSYVGFFGYVTGTIKNFNIKGANVSVNGTPTIDNYAAIACGYATTKIVGVSTDGYLNAATTGNVGGVVGYTANTLQDCSNSADISAPEADNVGGVVGQLAYQGTYDLAHLSNDGSIVGANNVGGIVGFFNNHATWAYNDSTYRNQLHNLANNGAVSGHLRTGGVIGYLDAAITGGSSDGSVIITVTEMSNNANVTGNTRVGGLLGYAYTDNASSQILTSNSTGVITAQAYVGGLAGMLENIKLIDCDNTGTQVIATYYESNGTTYYAYVGGYAGLSNYVENCHNAADITYEEHGMYVGGIAGYSVGAIVNCSNTADINAENASYVGGVAGRFSNQGSFTFNNLINNGDIVGTDFVGGVMGTLSNMATWAYNDSTYHLNMTALQNTGNVTGYQNVGGLIGRVEASITGGSSDGYVITSLIDSQNIANVTGDTYVGGVFGYATADSGSSHITNVNSTGVITAKSHVGGLAGWLANIKLLSCDNVGSQIVATSYTSNETTYYAYVGGYVGYGYYIENCHNTVAITYPERGSYVGGIAGATNANIVNCSNSANILAEKASYVGGIMGLLSTTGNLTLTDLTNSGEIVGTNYVSGLIGYLNNHATWAYNDTNYSISLRNLHNTADISGVTYVGGLFGRINAQITGSSSDGTVSVTILESSNSGNITGNESVGSYIGAFYSDRTSTINGYVLEGSVNGETTSLATLVGVQSNLNVTQA